VSSRAEALATLAGGPTAGADAVVSHHLNPFTSGVARFNQVLARELGVPVIGLFDEGVDALGAPLLSFKVSELDAGEVAALEGRAERLAEHGGFQLFLHDYRGMPLERRLVEAAARVWCGNAEIAAQVGPLTDRAATVWAPGLIADTRRYEPSATSVFSFGMAHKLRTDEFVRLRSLLEASGRSYTVSISNANHETSTMGDAQLLYDEMQEVFGSRLYFLGNLSDVAVFNHLVSATFFAAFFRAGARANNTSIASAMEHGAVVITNLDEFSPPYLRHMDNVIDIEQAAELPSDPLVLRKISVRAMETSRELSWPNLVLTMRQTDTFEAGDAGA